MRTDYWMRSWNDYALSLCSTLECMISIKQSVNQVIRQVYLMKKIKRLMCALHFKSNQAAQFHSLFPKISIYTGELKTNSIPPLVLHSSKQLDHHYQFRVVSSFSYRVAILLHVQSFSARNQCSGNGSFDETN